MDLSFGKLFILYKRFLFFMFFLYIFTEMSLVFSSVYFETHVRNFRNFRNAKFCKIFTKSFLKFI